MLHNAGYASRQWPALRVPDGQGEVQTLSVGRDGKRLPRELRRLDGPTGMRATVVPGDPRAFYSSGTQQLHHPYRHLSSLR
jgi:hypothetical protein